MRSLSREASEWNASPIARTDLENVNGFILTCAFRGETLRAMDRVLEDKLRLSGMRLGRTDALSRPREKKRPHEGMRNTRTSAIGPGTYVVEELSFTVPVPSGVLPPQETNRDQLFVFKQRTDVMRNEKKTMH
jgi:hypothetical protein